jgi:hypothetical protein
MNLLPWLLACPRPAPVSPAVAPAPIVSPSPVPDLAPLDDLAASLEAGMRAYLGGAELEAAFAPMSAHTASPDPEGLRALGVATVALTFVNFRFVIGENEPAWQVDVALFRPDHAIAMLEVHPAQHLGETTPIAAWERDHVAIAALATDLTAVLEDHRCAAVPIAPGTLARFGLRPDHIAELDARIVEGHRGACAALAGRTDRVLGIQVGSFEWELRRADGTLAEWVTGHLRLEGGALAVQIDRRPRPAP